MRQNLFGGGGGGARAPPGSTTYIMRGLYLALQTSCIRQPERQLPSSSYNHNTQTTLTTSVREHLLALRSWKFLTATLKYICNDSFIHVEGCQCVVVVR